MIEDNKALASGIAHKLRDDGHAVDVLHHGDDGEDHMRREGADLVILDLSLPGLDGLEILKKMRGRMDDTPVLLLTAKTETSDRVIGLDAGADDYLTKPFEMDELQARIRALARRRSNKASVVEPIGSLAFDRSGRRLIHDGTMLDVPRRELAAFECLFDRRGQFVAKSVLADHLYGVGSDVEETVVEVHISRLRKRLKDFGVTIKTARGLGYLLEAEQ